MLKQHGSNRKLFTAWLLAAWLTMGCSEEEKKGFERYYGPVEEVYDVGVRYSEGGKVTVEMKTPRQLRYENDNKVFPDSVTITFYDDSGIPITTVRSDSGRFENARNIYTVIGNVVVVNTIKQEYLYTSILNWNPVTQKVYNDTTNRIVRKKMSDVLNGTGLDARQDFSEMALRRVSGIFSMKSD